jgi:hypothetical protein
MKIKSILFVFLMLVALVTASKFIINSVDVTAKTVETSKVNQSVTTPTNHETQFAAVNSGQNSELIPDRIAYLMVFRLLSSYKNEAERNRLRGYVQQNLGITDNNEIEAVFRLADDFKQRTIPLDNQINAIKDRYHPTHSPFNNDDRKKLEKLKKDKEKIVDDLIRDLPNRLSANGKDKLHRNIQEKVKQKIKMQD